MNSRPCEKSFSSALASEGGGSGAAVGAVVGGGSPGGGRAGATPWIGGASGGGDDEGSGSCGAAGSGVPCARAKEAPNIVASATTAPAQRACESDRARP